MKAFIKERMAEAERKRAEKKKIEEELAKRKKEAA
jgi:hypothetical protein